MSFGVEVGIGERVGRREGGGGGDVEFVAKLIPTDLPDLYEPQFFI